MSETMLAPCGINCALCDTYLATIADDDKMRQSVADKWSALFHHPFRKEDINCVGCTNDGIHGIYCGTLCEIRPCAQAKGISDCKQCPDYLCEPLRKNLEASSQYIKE